MRSVSRSGAVPSPPYNMGLVGEHQKTNLLTQCLSRVRKADNTVQPLSVVCDKLRLGFYTRVHPQHFVEQLTGVRSGKVGLTARRFGNEQVPQARAWTKPPKSDGGVYWQDTKIPSLPSGQSYVVVEFNPQKVEDDELSDVGVSLASLGVTDIGSLFVERYDVAFDYRSPRHHLFLDDRKRLMDMFGLGRRGPQTERTGFRSGSDLRAQLYDKTVERRSVGSDVAADIVRFELGISNPDPMPDAPLYGKRSTDSLQLRDLPHVPYPGGGITVRSAAFDPLRVASHVYGSLTAYARGLGIRAALGYAREVFQMTLNQRDEWLETMLPELDHSPRQRFGLYWPMAASDQIARLEAALCHV